MKKLIFILIIAASLFSLSVNVRAADTLGTCKLKNKTTAQEIQYADKTEAQCHAMANDPANNAEFVSWTTTNTPTTDYKLLSPLPCPPGSDCSGMLTSYEFSDSNNLSRYLNLIIKLFIGICAVLAVMMIVIGGLEYMTSELISNKEHGKEKILHAIFGLVLALGAWTILNQINPDLLKVDLATSMPGVTVQVDLGGEGTAAFTARSPASLQAIGINCPGAGGSSDLVDIAQSFVGRSQYSMEQRNAISGGKAMVDCSSYVSQVYACAGLGNPGGTTAGIFGSAGTPVTSISDDGTTVNGTALRVGDLLGWKQGENGEKWGHVVMYIGNGQVIDAQRSGVAPRPLNSTQFKGRIKYINRVNAGTSGGW